MLNGDAHVTLSVGLSRAFDRCQIIKDKNAGMIANHAPA